MISSTLLITAFITSIGSTDLVTTDEVAFIDSHLILVHGRIEDRIGNQIQLSGIHHRLSLSQDVKIPRRGRRERSPLLQFTLLEQPNGWEVIQVSDSISWDQILQEHRSRIDQLAAERRELVCRFLLRESPEEIRGSMWRSLEIEWKDDPVRWIKLGGEFLSSQRVLSEQIEKRKLQNLATTAGLYLHHGKWISRTEFYRLNRLSLVDGQVIDMVRIELRELAVNHLDQLLKQSKKDHVAGEVQPGTLRKSLRALWGDPGAVTWVQWKSHMLEQWEYPGQIVHIINGRVCRVDTSDSNPAR